MITITRTGDLQAGGSRFYLTVVDGTAISRKLVKIYYELALWIMVSADV